MHNTTTYQSCAGAPFSKMPRPASAPSPAARRPTGRAGGVLPPDQFLGPTAGKQTVYETVKKLNYDLFRAEERSKHVEAVKEEMTRKHRIYEENVQRVKGAL